MAAQAATRKTLIFAAATALLYIWITGSTQIRRLVTRKFSAILGDLRLVTLHVRTDAAMAEVLGALSQSRMRVGRSARIAVDAGDKKVRINKDLVQKPIATVRQSLKHSFTK